jgi:DNA-binding SARP family transcriptional activator
VDRSREVKVQTGFVAELRTLGCWELRSVDGQVLAPGPLGWRALALMTYLLLDRPRGGRARDALARWFWPDRQPASRRRHLSYAVARLDRLLGTDAVVRSGRWAVDLRPGLVWCDATAVEEAGRRDEPETVGQLYRGVFVPAAGPGISPQFEAWIGTIRERVARIHLDALECLARRASQCGQHLVAVDLWRRAVAEDPGSARLTLSLMEALETVGDRAGALRQAQTHTELMAHRFNAVADPDVAALAERMRRQPRGRRRLGLVVGGQGAPSVEIARGTRRASGAM